MSAKDVARIKQQLVAVEKIRQQLIRYVTKVDVLGIYSDADCLDNGCPILTIEELVTCTVEAIFLYEHYMTVNRLM